MRIIAGELKGRKLLPVTDKMPVRPTSDRAREAVFSILGQRIRDARVLDLFAGTGAMGIEALSRGAAFCLFVDQNRDCAAYILKNLERFRLTRQSQVSIGNISKGPGFLARPLSAEAPSPAGFSIIFADPPYDSDALPQALSSLAAADALAPDAIICCEHPKGKSPTAPGFTLVDSRRYGRACFSFFEKE